MDPRTLSARLSALAHALRPVADDGARATPQDGKLLVTELDACTVLARELEARLARRVLNAIEADRRMFGTAHQDSAR